MCVCVCVCVCAFSALIMWTHLLAPHTCLKCFTHTFLSVDASVSNTHVSQVLHTHVFNVDASVTITHVSEVHQDNRCPA